MRTLAVLGASALLVDGARVNKKRHSSEAQKTDSFSAYDGKPALGVKICNAEELEEVLEVGGGCTFLTEFFDGMPADGSCIEDTMVCDEEAVPKLMQRSYLTQVKMLHEDAGAYFRSNVELPQSYMSIAGAELSEDFFAEWRTSDAMDARVEAAVAASGGIAKLEVAGKSLQGRDMKIVRFTGAGYQAGMPKVVLTFNLHAREWITGMAGVYAVERLVQKVKASPGYLDGVEVVMMPMANPDGFKHTEGLARFHRKNMNTNSSLCLGTDLNRNFPTGWDSCSSLKCGSTVPCADTFKGREAGGEPESQVIMKVLQESKMTVMIDVHSFTQLVLASWGWTDEPHPRAAEFAELGNKMTNAIAARHDTTWRYGTPPQILYKAVGTLTDYATSLGALGYCYELRPQSKAWSLLGFAPPASYILPSAEECFDGILVAIEHAKAS